MSETDHLYYTDGISETCTRTDASILQARKDIDHQEKGILAHHENMVIAVTVGIARMNVDGTEWKEIAVGTGFAEIVNNRVTLIVDTAEKPEDIDVRRAREQKERAEEQLRQKQSIQQYYHTQASLARAMNRLRLSQDKKWNL